jgi:hypothetical protein
VRAPPDKQQGPAANRAPQRSDTTQQQIAHTVARERVHAIDRRCRIACMADQLMPMAVYYGPRRLRPIPLGQERAEGWWAA